MQYKCKNTCYEIHIRSTNTRSICPWILLWMSWVFMKSVNVFKPCLSHQHGIFRNSIQYYSLFFILAVPTTSNETVMYHIVANTITCILNLLLEAYHQPTLYNSWAYQSGGDLMKGVYTCSTEFINRLNPVIHKMFNDKFQQYIFFSLSIFDK